MIVKRLMSIALLIALHVHAADQHGLDWQLLRAFQDDASFIDIKNLIERGAKIEFVGECIGGSTALHYAATSSSEDNALLFYLLEEHNINANVADWEGCTPCHMAAACDRGDRIEILYQKGADVNAKGEKESTPLHFAVVNGALHSVQALLACGATQEKDVWGKTPISIARYNEHQNIVKCLEEWESFSEIKEPGID